MSRKGHPINPGTSGSDSDPSGSKRKEILDNVKLALGIAKESYGPFSPLKATIGDISTIIKQYEEIQDVREKIEDLISQLNRFKQIANAAIIDGDQEEKQRRSEFTSVLGEIEERSRVLLEKGAAVRFLDKDKDSKEVAKLIERLRGATTHYQMSQHQAIYDRITNLTVPDIEAGSSLQFPRDSEPEIERRVNEMDWRLENHTMSDWERLKLFNELCKTCSHLTNSGTSGSDSDPGGPKKRGILDSTKTLLDIARVSYDMFLPLKAALGGMSALLKHYEEPNVRKKIGDLILHLDRFKQIANAAIVDGDQEEKQRSSELFSVLEEIEERSRVLLEKGAVVRLMDKDEDSGEVARLIERLQETTTHYQISQQQAIYDQIMNLTVPDTEAGSFFQFLRDLEPEIEERVNEMDKRLENHAMSDRERLKLFNKLCKACGRHRVIPKSMHIPDCSEDSVEVESGGYANVSQSTYEGRRVAVKVVRVYITSDLDVICSRFCREAVTWKHLRHPNILPLLGVTVGEHQLAMVSEWMENGNINGFIQKDEHVNRTELLVGVANGLMYMHDLRIVHGDLKGANILINKDRRACIADFGLSTITGVATHTTAAGASRASLISNDTLMSFTASGTPRWMSPELLDPERFGMPESEENRPTRQSDCYALGMVIYEVLCGHHPYLEFQSDILAVHAITEGVRPEKPEEAERLGFSNELWRTIELCWLEDRSARPDIEDIRSCLNDAAVFWYMREF